MRTVTFFAILLLFFSASLALDSGFKCTFTDDCLDLNSDKNVYCDTNSNTCKATTVKNFKDLTTSQAESCSGSLRATLGCVKLVGDGCPQPALADLLFYTCVGGSYNGTACQVLSDGPTPTYKALGENCDENNNQCGWNLKCHSGVCIKLPQEGERCFNDQCTQGLTCDLGICIAQGSLPPKAKCGKNTACSSGQCKSGFCQGSARNEGCFSNSDCISSSPVSECDNRAKTPNGLGVCFSPMIPAVHDNTLCSARVLSQAYYPEKPDLSKCTAQEVKFVCSMQCNKRADRRMDTTRPYIYDCQALTKTPITQCDVSTQFLNCEAYKNYPNGVQSLAAPAKMIVMLALAAIAFLQDGDKNLYCDQNTLTCKAASKVEWQKAVRAESEACSDSIAVEGICLKIAGPGCLLPDATSALYTKCAGGFFNGTLCAETVYPTFTYKKEGEECDFGNNGCGTNLVCLQGTCKKLPGVGEPCYQDTCAGGLQCNFGRCILPYSVPAGGPCSSFEVCESGTCTNRFCAASTRNQGCMTNNECRTVTIDADCDNRVKNPKGLGMCFDAMAPARKEYKRCQAVAAASAYYPAEADYSKCDPLEVKAACATVCGARADTRYNDKPYIYDCKALTKTPIDSSKCSVTEQFLNCEAYKNYPNGVESLAAPAKLIALLAVAAIAFILF